MFSMVICRCIRFKVVKINPFAAQMVAEPQQKLQWNMDWKVLK